MKYRVLLVGKNAKQTENYAHLIRDMEDCQIDEMSRIENAMHWVAKTRYNLVVLDHAESFEFLEKIKRIHPESSVLIIADQPSVESAVRALRMGAEDYIKKPVNTDQFRLAVRRCLGRKPLFENDGKYSRYLGLVNACQMISSSMEEERVFAILQSFLARELGSDLVGLFKERTNGGIDWIKVGPGTDSSSMDEIFETALKAGHLPTRLKEESFYIFIKKSPKAPSLFVMRFNCTSEQSIYFVCLKPIRPESIVEFEAQLKILRAQIEVTGRNILRYQDIQEMAYVDDLTGLHNTRYLNHVLDREIAKYNETGRAFAVLFIDVDRFKLVNDTYGHVYGSQLLSELGAALRLFVRESDSVARYGGDEFVAVLSQGDLISAKTVAERIRSSVEGMVFLQDAKLELKITISIGVAVFPQHAQSKTEIIEAADQAMYCAKKQSRNMVYVSELKVNPGHV